MEKFVIDAEKILQLLDIDSAHAFTKYLYDGGCIVGKLAERPGSCKGCLFEEKIYCPVWDFCPFNEILIWNHHSKYYVQEDTK